MATTEPAQTRIVGLNAREVLAFVTIGDEQEWRVRGKLVHAAWRWRCDGCPDVAMCVHAEAVVSAALEDQTAKEVADASA